MSEGPGRRQRGGPGEGPGRRQREVQGQRCIRARFRGHFYHSTITAAVSTSPLFARGNSGSAALVAVV